MTQSADNGNGNSDRLDQIESILVRIAERQDRIAEQQEANMFQLGQLTETATDHDRRLAQIESGLARLIQITEFWSETTRTNSDRISVLETR
ncbi:MAG: hypothetical protein AAGE59_21785 [Cyanobacteria bacterium P01_F01_bin.86]